MFNYILFSVKIKTMKNVREEKFLKFLIYLGLTAIFVSVYYKYVHPLFLQTSQYVYNKASYEKDNPATTTLSKYIISKETPEIKNIFYNGGTIIASIYPPNEKEKTTIIMSKANKDHGWMFYTKKNKKGNFYLGLTKVFTDGLASWETAETIKPYEWSQIAIIYNDKTPDNEPLFYIEEEKVTVKQISSSAGTHLSDGGIDFSILSGNIKDIQFYNTALTEEEITAIYEKTDLNTQ